MLAALHGADKDHVAAGVGAATVVLRTLASCGMPRGDGGLRGKGRVRLGLGLGFGLGFGLGLALALALTFSRFARSAQS